MCPFHRTSFSNGNRFFSDNDLSDGVNLGVNPPKKRMY